MEWKQLVLVRYYSTLNFATCGQAYVSYDLSDGQEKTANHMLDFVEDPCLKSDILLYIDIFSVAFCKFRC